MAEEKPTKQRYTKRFTLEERFWAKVDKTPGHGPQGDCWVWAASRNPRTSYGQLHVTDDPCAYGQPRLAHRISYGIAFGTIPDGLHVLHHCDNPPCVRPDHLWVGTDADNVADMIRKGRDRRARGDASGSRKHPESRPRGVNHQRGRAKLTEEQVLSIWRDYLAGGVTQRALAKRVGVNPQTIWNLLHGYAWPHLVPRT